MSPSLDQPHVVPVDVHRPAFAVPPQPDGVGVVAADGEDDVVLRLGDGDLQAVVEHDAGWHVSPSVGRRPP